MPATQCKNMRGVENLRMETLQMIVGSAPLIKMT